jgi:hypothetical protein
LLHRLSLDRNFCSQFHFQRLSSPQAFCETWKVSRIRYRPYLCFKCAQKCTQNLIKLSKNQTMVKLYGTSRLCSNKKWLCHFLFQFILPSMIHIPN